MSTTTSQPRESRTYGNPKDCANQGYAVYEYQITNEGAYLELKEGHCNEEEAFHPVGKYLTGFAIGNTPGTIGYGYDVPLWQGDLVVVCCVNKQKGFESKTATNEEKERLLSEAKKTTAT